MKKHKKLPRPLRERVGERGTQSDASIVNATVCKIDFLNQEINGKPKSVFYCPSYEKPEGRMCVLWDYTTIDVGDEIKMKGRFNGDVFLVWDLQILKKGKKNEIQTQ